MAKLIENDQTSDSAPLRLRALINPFLSLSIKKHYDSSLSKPNVLKGDATYHPNLPPIPYNPQRLSRPPLITTPTYVLYTPPTFTKPPHHQKSHPSTITQPISSPSPVTSMDTVAEIKAAIKRLSQQERNELEEGLHPDSDGLFASKTKRRRAYAKSLRKLRAGPFQSVANFKLRKERHLCRE